MKIDVKELLPVMLSIPTSATRPANPKTKPNKRVLCQTVLSPFTDAKIVAQIGTVATSKPASPDEISFSADEIRYQGPIISAAAYGITYFQPLIISRTPPCLSAIGINKAAPIMTRPKTMTDGVKVSTAIFMNMYGIPHSKPTNRNKERERRLN